MIARIRTMLEMLIPLSHVAISRRVLVRLRRLRSLFTPRLWGLMVAALFLVCLGDRAFDPRREYGWHDDRDG